MAGLSKIGALHRNHFFNFFPQAETFCRSVSEEFKISVKVVHEALLNEIFFMLKEDEPDTIIEEWHVDEALKFCKIALEKGAYTPMFESLEEMLTTVVSLRRSAVFFSFLRHTRSVDFSPLWIEQ